jgi:heptosyltransferase-2
MTPARAGSGAPPRVAVIAPNWLGDAVMALPAIARAGHAAPVAVVAPRYTARVFWKAPGVGEVWVDPAGGRAARVRARVQALRAWGARAALVLPPSFSSALAPFLAGVPERVGFAGEGRRALLSTAPATPPRTRHLTQSYLDLAGRLAPAAGAAPEAARLWVAEADRAGIARVLAAAGVRGPYAVVVPGAAFGPAKAWPAERYRALCERLGADLPVVVTGGPGDRPVCGRVADGLARVTNLAGATGLGEFFALVEGARVLVANDSGAPHVAAALGTPVVVLFGSTSPVWTAPRGDAVAVLQHVVHCNPCFRRRCPTQLECFHGIAVEDVEARARSFLAGVAGRP